MTPRPRFPLAEAYARAQDAPEFRISEVGPADDPRVIAQHLTCGETVELLSSYQAVMWCEAHRCPWQQPVPF